MYQEEQWLEQVDMSLTDKQSRALGWDQRSVLVEMFSFLCIALVSFTLVFIRGDHHDYEKCQMGELIKSVVVASLYFVGFLALPWVVTSRLF